MANGHFSTIGGHVDKLVDEAMTETGSHAVVRHKEHVFHKKEATFHTYPRLYPQVYARTNWLAGTAYQLMGDSAPNDLLFTRHARIRYISSTASLGL